MMTNSIRFAFVLLACVTVGLTLSVPRVSLAQDEEPVNGDPGKDDAAALLDATLQNVGLSPKSGLPTDDAASTDEPGFFDRFRLPFSNDDESGDSLETEAAPSAQTTEIVATGADSQPDAPVETADSPPTTNAAGTPSPVSSGTATPVAPVLPTLDELLRRAQLGTISQEEILLSRLNKREEVVKALKRTLDVSAGVATHGEAAIQLLADDDLAAVITTLIARVENDAPAVTITTPSNSIVEPIAVVPSSEDNDEDPRFDDYTPVFTRQRDGIVEVGMRHPASGFITVLHKNERWHVGDDTVVLKDVLKQPSATTIVFDLNGTRVNVPL